MTVNTPLSVVRTRKGKEAILVFSISFAYLLLGVTLLCPTANPFVFQRNANNGNDDRGDGRAVVSAAVAVDWRKQECDKNQQGMIRRSRRRWLQARSVTGYSLVNAETLEDIVSLSDGDVVDLSQYDSTVTSYSIRAETTGDVLSVTFDLDGVVGYGVTSGEPYVLVDSIRGRRAIPRLALNGLHVITARAHPRTNGRGSGIGELSVSFTIVNSNVDVCTLDEPDSIPDAVSTDIPSYPASSAGTLNGEMRLWHKVTIGFRGPMTCERATPNPFTDYRLDVRFEHSDTETVFVVPGYYAADGNAANTGATSGDVWLVHFAPTLTGTWTWTASFVQGTNVAQDELQEVVRQSVFFDASSGSFTVLDTDKGGGRDHRGKGLLEYVGEHHLRFAGTGEYFMKAGADSPENFLAYDDFDNTANWNGYRKSWSPHVVDYREGMDPTWGGGRGTGMIGAINYLSAQSMNVFSFLPMNIDGDDRNVFPYVSRVAGDDRLRIDVSKTAQWEAVFEHADHMGMYLHFKTQETENDQLLDGGALGLERKLYYRELIARFAHHLALNWNIGEENTNTVEERIAFSEYFKSVDPYKHPIVIHTNKPRKEEIYPYLLGLPSYDGASLQCHLETVHNDTLRWITASASSGHKWVVANDEQNFADQGVIPDADDPEHDDVRKLSLWGNLMAGGAGVEYYFGYSYPNSDLTCEDFRSRANMWTLSRYALEFFATNGVPFWEMSNADDVVSNNDAWCLTRSDLAVIVLYLRNGGTVNLDLARAATNFSVRWYDPRNGGSLQNGSVTTVVGGGEVEVGVAPDSVDEDWVVLLQADTASTTVQPSSDPSPAPTIEPTNALHPDIVKVISVEGARPGRSWADSYSVGNMCYCDSTFDHDIADIMVDTGTQLGNLTVVEICELIGEGPGDEGRPRYNDIQCGNGPPNSAGDEELCPGRVDLGREGCGQIGPTWNFDVLLEDLQPDSLLGSAAPTNTPTLLPTPGPTAVPTVPVTISQPPTSKPSPGPTKTPTLDPTLDPSEEPTPVPTTAEPSSGPSQEPTTRPSSGPTTSGPTSEPSQEPTAVPTTAGPTFEPSHGPTPKPSSAPTTLYPTLEPSGGPTPTPTIAGSSFAPSSGSTPGPSAGPATLDPTSEPSLEPTTQSPTLGPLENPTSRPVSEPTPEPSSWPSQTPTSEPISIPTTLPTLLDPTVDPSQQPTLEGSTSPSLIRSAEPSSGPSSEPSSGPTTQGPTSEPMERPSSEPTAQPVPFPTSVPSSRASEQPTFEISSGPSALPTLSTGPASTRKPSPVPTFGPTGRPTLLPSLAPTSEPSRKPTFGPTLKPSTAPTKTEVPTLSPIWEPSNRPSHGPTMDPSQDPSHRPSSRPTTDPGEPTDVPSLEPTSRPTAEPTSPDPTAGPTPVPTSSDPTAGPTPVPTHEPTSPGPTAGPTPFSGPPCPCWDESDLENVTLLNQSTTSCYINFRPNDGPFYVIQNDRSSFTFTQGGFAASSTMCATRDPSDVLQLIGPDEAETCIGEIMARCIAIGTPIE